VTPTRKTGADGLAAVVSSMAKPDPLGKLVRSPERREGGYAVSPEVLQAAIDGRLAPTVKEGPQNFFTSY